MNLALNIFNFVFFGFATVIGWLFATIVSVLLIVTLPYSRSCWEITKMSLAPFGNEIVHIKYLQPTSAIGNGIGSVLNIVWFVCFGWWLCLLHIVTGISQCLTIIGIPSGIAHFKLAGIALFPVGQRVVPSDVAQAAKAEQIRRQFENRSE
ncbi:MULTISPECIES: YccF domain-containing protein [Testudinibacter]|uniref:Inner membrane protein YccF n=1 Tax=Testudinibacter aquarius TaxID=1524974 RepID=A0A4V2W2X9_9PAST|nr:MULTISPECIES: YccF domain-containing protein [Testudinibacter]TNG95827.1 YccF domain-containing protein [Pasteurellaceae bacterium USgator41]TNG97033.1 YccF domain-containing protein [Pasteurellaceae bacterium UScroc12]TNH00854.1 YccF domain-containing protein [Pasteurellaceae bacterium UScroc31]TNH02379.1 YccF domain-containing protein [Pasteurellaceae bacterium USgator11]TNH04983.1 YccF domain-containing protein [Pasteurellaceae bacterium Phil31]TNH06355.1 YccF domain-containing protein 